jgi:hypothetical protein
MATMLLLSVQCLAQEPVPGDSKAERDARLAFMKEQAAAYTLKLEGSDAPLALHPDAVLRFSNPVSGVPDGIIAMWTDGQRPAVLAQVFQTKDGLWVHECQSLAAEPLTMQQGEKVFWNPAEAAESFRRLDDAPAPAASAGRRLVQMKSLAAEFTAADDFKIRLEDKEPTRHELRLLPTPIHRYADAAAGIADGAVFAFVHGTDPEVFLVLEGRADNAGQGGGDKLSWHYTLAPMTCWAVDVKRGNASIWSVPERLKSSARGTYHVWLHKPQK